MSRQTPVFARSISLKSYAYATISYMACQLLSCSHSDSNLSLENSSIEQGVWGVLKGLVGILTKSLLGLLPLNKSLRLIKVLSSPSSCALIRFSNSRAVVLSATSCFFRMRLRFFSAASILPLLMSHRGDSRQMPSIRECSYRCT